MVDRQPVYFATVRRADYERFREIMSDEDLPVTFDDWEKELGEKITKLTANGLPHKKVIVDLKDYATFCLNSGLDENSTTLAGYAVSRDYPD